MYSGVVGGYGDTVSGNYSYLFGISGKLTADSTFMVDMPHIRFGDEVTGYEFPTQDGSANQILMTDGSGRLSWSDVPQDNDWVRGVSPLDSVLFTSSYLGIARGGAGNMLYGSRVYTHVNLGVACTTGVSGEDHRYIVVGGGYRNVASDNYATVGGGFGNVASDYQATVGGGAVNTASGYRSFVGGGYSNEATGSYAIVAGGYNNTASYSYATVSGGRNNCASSSYATVGGGYLDTVLAVYGGVFSGYDNLAGDEAADTAAVVVGGWSNSATGKWTFIGGGYENTASGLYASVVGGYQNQATANDCFIGGGSGNTASVTFSAVGAGVSNRANGDRSFIGAGTYNYTGGWNSVVGAGYADTVKARYGGILSGWGNLAGDDTYDTAAVVVGGRNNSATGRYSSVGGGRDNTAGGDYSFAAGHRAKANHSGTFVWADAQDADFASTSNNQFLIRASGGVGIGTSNPQGQLHVSGGTGSVDVVIEADTDNSGEEDQPALSFLQDGGTVVGRIGYFDGTNKFTVKNVYNDALVLGTDDTTRVTIWGDGQVDIADVLRVQNNKSWPTSGAGLEIAYNPSINRGYIQVYDRNSSSWGQLYLGDAQVLIGTTSGTPKLYVRCDDVGKTAIWGNSPSGVGGSFSNSNNDYYALRAINNSGTGASVRGLYVQGHGYATGGWQTFLADGRIGYSPVSSEREIILSGSASLRSGMARIVFERGISEVIADNTPLRIIVTPTGECNGIYVAEKSPIGFTVKELMDGRSNVTFDWIAIGRLKVKDLDE